MVVRHGSSGNAGTLVDALSRHLDSSEVRVEVFSAPDIQDGSPLEPFMHGLRANDSLVLVHLIEATVGDALANELSGEVIDGVVAIEHTLRERFPALVEVDSWVLIDLGRSWSDSAREVAQSLLAVAEDNRIRSVLAVTGSTTGSVAGDADDRAGMLADAAWALAAGGLGDVPGLNESIRVWAVGSNSFTLNADAWSVICTSRAVSDAIDAGLLKPAAEGELDEALSQAAKWVLDREIGTEAERARIRSGPLGDASELLTVHRDEISQVIPEDWATAADREYLRLAGAPLARYTRVVQGNAQALASGRPGEEAGGHVAALDDALTLQLRSPSGCLRAARFINGLSASLSDRARAVANSPHRDPREIDLDRTRRDLELAVTSMARVKPWSVRIGLMVLTVAVLVHLAVWPLVLALPVLAALVLIAWGGFLRRRARKARDRYVAAIEDRVQALADQRLLEAQMELVKTVQGHAGAFLDSHDALIDMEAADMPAAGTCAADVRRIWDDAHVVRDRFREPNSALQAAAPVPSCGQFFRSYPENEDDARTIASSRSPSVEKSRRDVFEGAEAILRTISLDWTLTDLTDRLKAVCVERSATPRGVQGLSELDPRLTAKVLERLRDINQPRLDSRTKPVECCVIVTPQRKLPEGISALAEVDARALRSGSCDQTRISVVWLSAQDFATPTRKPLADCETTTDQEAGDTELSSGFAQGGI